ncbi:hypothetical protein ElyMa_002009600 [Elysia marginata]|uniref:Cilia- and flagella-associated protein 126 n=1 Tax=Elysia marginata TaxID=1093978 RepID=A0AAV4F612_9GAST|nr:hypothetical protein ElyMa_002009600 [Elysia marginata]
MAHLLPPAGVKSTKHEAFMFNTVYAANFFKRSTSDNIPPNIHDYRWTDYKALDRRCREKSAAIQAEQNRKSYSTIVPRSKFNPAGPCPATVKDQWRVAPCACPQHRGVGYKGGRDCACMADRPPRAGWSQDGGGYLGNIPQTENYSPSTPVVYGYGSGGYQSRLEPDQVTSSHPRAYCPPIGIDPRCLVRPRNKALPHSERPSGAPYFAQESKPSCPEPQGAPVLRRTGFTFDDWLQTVDQREPPASLQGACIPSMAHWCGTQSVNCNPTAFLLVPFQTGYCY